MSDRNKYLTTFVISGGVQFWADNLLIGLLLSLLIVGIFVVGCTIYEQWELEYHTNPTYHNEMTHDDTI